MRTLPLRLVLLLLLLIASPCVAQNGRDTPPPLSDALRADTVERVASLIETRFWSVEHGRRMAAHLRERQAEGAYVGITDPHEFARVLMAELMDIADDGHLSIEYDPAEARELRERDARPEGPGNDRRAPVDTQRPGNYGFRRVECLAGDVGYLRLDLFANSRFGGATAAAAMNLLANSDAVIVDLRFNGGGSPTMVQLLASYFYDDDDVELCRVVSEADGSLAQYRTLPLLPGKRMPDVPLVILTSRRSFSAAEAFAYSLQALGRATVIGERTAGAAGLTGGPRYVNDHFVMTLAVASTLCPATGTNWEAEGVVPDVELPAELALDEAHGRLLDRILVPPVGPDRLNAVGYQLLGEEKMELAIRVFERNVELHPDYANGFDSLGEAHAIAQHRERAIECYERALEMDPGMDSAREALERLRRR